MISRLILFLIINFPVVAFGYSIDLVPPLQCKFGVDCFVSSYFDHSGDSKDQNKDDPVKNAQDYKCGFLSNIGQKSTNFIIKNQQQMADGVKVLAAESGVIKQIRDGMDDLSVDQMGYETIRGNECGNALIIEHPRGYTTEYCNLRKGSITVKVDDKVKQGDAIAEAGISGDAEYPGVKFYLRRDGEYLDPFTGDDPKTGSVSIECGKEDIYPFWSRKTKKLLPYDRSSLVDYGFSGVVPNFEAVVEGRINVRNLNKDSKIISFWVDLIGIKKGDELYLAIMDSDKEILKEEKWILDKDKVRHFQFIGLKDKPVDGKSYKAIIRLKNSDSIIIDKLVEYKLK